MSIDLAKRAASGDLAGDVGNWIAAAMTKYLAGDDIEKSLGLDSASRQSVRNRALLDAAEILDTGDLTPWQLAGRLAAAIQRFETRVLPRCRRETSITPSPLNAALWRAFESGFRMTRHQRKLLDLLR